MTRISSSLTPGPCPNCGATLRGFKSGSSVGQQCTACDWTVVTTNHHAPSFDPERYDVVIVCTSEERRNAIAVVAALLGVGSGTVRGLVDCGLPVRTGLQALEVQHLLRDLSQKGVRVLVTPDFPWPLLPGPASTHG